MKAKLSLAFLTLALVLTVTTSHASFIGGGKRKAEKERIANMSEEQKLARLEEIKSRVEEIKAIDKSTLSASERKAMKKELKEMNREAKATRGGGVYLSVGAIIIIILLLILLL